MKPIRKHYTCLVLCCITFLIFVHKVSAEIDTEFIGYLEDTIMGEYVKNNKKEIIFHSIRARINYSGKYEDTGDFGITLIGTLHSGATSLDLTDYLPVEDADTIPFPILYEMENDYWLQEAFGSLYLNRFTFRVGRQKYYTGTGYAWNPTDLFNHKNVFDPTYEIEGLDSLWTSVFLPKNMTFNLFYSFGTSHDNEEKEGETVNANDWQMKLNIQAWMWDMAILYSDAKKLFYDMTTHTAMEVKWQLVSSEISGALWGIGLHAEGGYALLENESTEEELPENLEEHPRFLVGGDYTFENELFVMVEYYFEGLGQTSSDDYSLNERLAYFSGNMDSIGRDNLFLGIRYPLSDLTEMELYGIFNLNDPSVVINPWITYIASDEIVVAFSAQMPITDGDESSLGRTGSSMLMRINFSF